MSNKLALPFNEIKESEPYILFSEQTLSQLVSKAIDTLEEASLIETTKSKIDVFLRVRDLIGPESEALVRRVLPYMDSNLFSKRNKFHYLGVEEYKSVLDALLILSVNRPYVLGFSWLD